MMRPLRFDFAGAFAPSTFLRLLLSMLMLAMFVLGGQAQAQEASSEATPMRAPPPPGDDDVLYNNASMVTQAVPSTMVVVFTTYRFRCAIRVPRLGPRRVDMCWRRFRR